MYTPLACLHAPIIAAIGQDIATGAETITWSWDICGLTYFPLRPNASPNATRLQKHTEHYAGATNNAVALRKYNSYSV